MSAVDWQALYELGRYLQECEYCFTAVTPLTHARILARHQHAADLRDIFGWNRTFNRDAMPSTLLQLAERAGVLGAIDDHWQARVRFASLNGDLFVHSGFPTTAADAVFFGPDTYRFANFLRHFARPAQRAVDIGAGSGAGGLSIRERVGQLCLTDINPNALEFAKVNSRLANAVNTVRLKQSDLLDQVVGEFDLIMANPPYLVDEAERAYRHGGGLFGAELSVRIVRESLPRLASGGQLLVYTASAIESGRDTFWQAVAPLLNQPNLRTQYFEIDPDVFGEELERPIYRAVDRLAVVGLVVDKQP